MKYSIKELSLIAGITTRTLRYYEEVGLLAPKRISSNSYRVYGSTEVDILQQILFYRQFGVSIDEIKKIIKSPDFDEVTALENHLKTLLEQKEHIETLINSVLKTISSKKGQIPMSDSEKLDVFKQQIEKDLKENEEKYGKELRERYDEKFIKESQKKYKNLTQDQFDEIQRLSNLFNGKLKEAILHGDPASKLAQEACELHKQWLLYFWPSYSKEAHKGLAQMYVDDERFTAYYEKIHDGATVFLRDAMNIFTQD